MAVDFDAIKVVIDQIDTKINETKVLIDEAAVATWNSPTLGLRNYSAADLAALKARYDTLKAEMQVLFGTLP